MKISIETQVDAPISQVWSAWTTPDDIKQWNFASDDWHCPAAELDLSPGGTFNYRMEARDGSMGFDFEGAFTVIDAPHSLEYALSDDRKVSITFSTVGQGTQVVETFDAEDENSAELQRQGWQSILDNFKKHVEGESR